MSAYEIGDLVYCEYFPDIKFHEFKDIIRERKLKEIGI